MEYAPRKKEVVVLLAALAAVGILVASLVPGSVRPHSGLPSEIEHVLAYMVGTALLTTVFRSRAVTICLVLVCVAGFVEIAQIFVPGRKPAVLDVLAGCAGVGLGYAIAHMSIWRRTCSSATDRRNTVHDLDG